MAQAPAAEIDALLRGDGHGHGHGHSHGLLSCANEQRTQNNTVLTYAIAGCTTLAIAQTLVGNFASSLALLADVPHAIMDMIGFALNLYANMQAAKQVG